MSIKARIAHWLHVRLLASVASRRPPDMVIGADHPDGPYMLRWWLTPWRGWYRHVPETQRTRWQRAACWLSRMLPNLYLHEFLRDDDDRALHDHPSWAVSFILKTGYIEHTIANGGIHHRTSHFRGSLRFLPPRHTHRIELFRQIVENGDPVVRQAWTLFLFGPTLRDWGFHCPDRGWVPWREFTAEGKPGEIGPGCGE